MFGDAKMTTAMLDRLTHHCDIIKIGNDAGASKAKQEDHPQPALAVSQPRPRLRRRKHYHPELVAEEEGWRSWTHE